MKTVLITGAAAGIGLATARLFQQQGYFVGIYDIDAAALDTLKNSGEFTQACFGVCDVRSRESIAAMFEDFSKHAKGRLDVLINNAGVLSSGNFEDISGDAHDAMIDINVRGATHVAQLGFPLLKATANSCMVNLCSMSSVHGVPRLAVYSSSKFYINGLTQALSLEWKKHGIRVTSVKPPFVKTAMVDHVEDSLKSTVSVDTEPADVAEAIFKAISGSRDGYFIGSVGKAWSQLDRLLPENIGRALTGYLTKN